MSRRLWMPIARVLDTFDLNLIKRGAPTGSDLRISTPDLPYQADLALDD